MHLVANLLFEETKNVKGIAIIGQPVPRRGEMARALRSIITVYLPSYSFCVYDPKYITYYAFEDVRIVLNVDHKNEHWPVL